MKVITIGGDVPRFDVSQILEKIFQDFTHNIAAGDERAYVNTVQAFKKNWKLSAAQEAVIRIVLSDVEVVMDVCEDEETMRSYRGCVSTILQCIVNGRWDAINNLFLTERSRPIEFLREMKYMIEQDNDKLPSDVVEH